MRRICFLNCKQIRKNAARRALGFMPAFRSLKSRFAIKILDYIFSKGEIW